MVLSLFGDTISGKIPHVPMPPTPRPAGNFFRIKGCLFNIFIYKAAGFAIIGIMTEKERIVEIFKSQIKGKKPDVSSSNSRHDGKFGHWLETQFAIHHNATNGADILGFELKNETGSKTTFGDWSANEYVFNNPDYFSVFTGKTKLSRRERFLEIFGKSNEAKNGRYSWAGEPCPKIANFNRFGQRLKVVGNNDIVAEYCHSKDARENKDLIVPEELRKDGLILARWYGNSTPEGKRGKCLKKKLEDKFNDKGWFTCKTDESGAYEKICFGEPMTFDNWINLVKSGVVFFDSGMYQGNARPYSQWRADNGYWNSLITGTFD
jgi:type-2 restriction enzyme scrFI